MIYPFLTAVLPTLTPRSVPELTLEQFDELAKEQLRPGDFARMTAGTMECHREMAKFREYLAYRTAQVRADRLGVEGNFPEPEEFQSEVDGVLGQLSAANPLEREGLVDAAEWRKLDDLETGHEMDAEHIAIYRMRLATLQKYAGRDESAAREHFEKALEKLSAAYLD